MATYVAVVKANGNYINHFSFSTEVSKPSITGQVKHRSLIEIGCLLFDAAFLLSKTGEIFIVDFVLLVIHPVLGSV